jgi:CubicO group peptidase (beta-lactamase class C family)
VICLSGLVLFGSPGTAQAQSKLDGLDAFIANSLADWDLPGLAVAVVVDDQVVFARGFGVKQIGRPDPIDADTQFQIGSVSKGFAAATIAALVDDGVVAWDDPVVQHLPWFRLKDPYVTRSVTIRDLLAHRSGMPAHAYPALTLQDAREVAEKARLLDGQLPLRQQYQYSNQAYGIAGLIVEAVTGKSWGDWVEERLFVPLAMKNSAASPYDVWERRFVAPTFLGSAPAGHVGIDDASDRNLAMPHGVDRQGQRRVLPWQSYDNLQPAGSVVSSARDMANWLRMHLNAGRFEQRQVLAEATVDEMHRPQIPAPSYFLFTEEGDDSYALGWEVDRFAGKTFLSHGGGIFGFPAYVAILPELEAGVVVLANGSTWTPYYPHQDIVTWVFARLLELEPRDWHKEAMARTDAILQQVEQFKAGQAATRLDGTTPSLPLAGYAGTYSSDITGPVHVELAAGKLRLQFEGEGAFSGELEHWHHDVFKLFFDGGDGQAYGSSHVVFMIGPHGKVTRMDLGAFGEYQRQ